MRMKRGQRTPEEDRARGKCREIVRAEGSYIRKTEDKKYVTISECERWPDGAVIAFRGWRDLLRQLERMTETPREKVA